VRAVLAAINPACDPATAGGDTWQYEVGTIFLKRMVMPWNHDQCDEHAAPKDAMRGYEKAQK